MIQLYKRDNTDYDSNGDYILHPESCNLKCELNGTWELTMQYPFDEGKEFNAIVNETVLAVPAPDSDKQLYRVYNVDKDMNGKTVYARPIFLDAANEVMLTDVRPTDKTGQDALNIMTKNTKYKAVSDITDKNTAYYIRKNLIEAIASDEENSFLNRWGGEITYDNYTININKSAGTDRGVTVVFGKNLTQISENINYDNIVTRIVPVAYNGYTLSGDKPWVDSSNISKYAVVRTKVIEYSDVKLTDDAAEAGETTYDTIAELRTALRQKCKEEFENGIDLPFANYKIEMVELSKTEEYKNYKILEKVNLGDTVYCRHSGLDIDIKAKVIGIDYDCINKRYNQIELGSAVQNYLTDLSSQIQSMLNAYDSEGNIKGESISGMINLMQTKLKASYEIAKKQIERAILFEDTNESSPTYGAMALGTTGFQIASYKNSAGDWVWKTFGTGEGFIADHIIAGALYSQNYIANSQGCKIDLNSGTVEINKGKINIATSANTDDVIKMNYNEWKLSFMPLQIILENTNEKFYLVIQAGGIFLHKYNNDGTNEICGSWTTKDGIEVNNINTDDINTDDINTDNINIKGTISIRGSGAVKVEGNEAFTGTIYSGETFVVNKGIITHVYE